MLFLPLVLFAHGSLVLMSTTSEKCYCAKIKPDGSFTFENVNPGTYTLTIVGPKDYFTAKADESSSEMTVENVRWASTETGARSISNMIIPVIPVTPDMLISPGYISRGEHKKEYSIILYSGLETATRANLTGSITNFSGKQDNAVKEVKEDKAEKAD